MAHEIETRNGTARMIYRGERPWHGLGKEIPAGLKLAVNAALQMAEMADLGVKLQQLQLPDGRTVEAFAAVRRDGVVVGAGMGKQYRVAQLEEVFAPLMALVDSGLAEIETVGSLKGGSRAFMLLRINRPDSVIVPAADDRVAKYLLAATSFDGSISHLFQLTATRVVCQNTLSVAIGERGAARFKIRHTRSAKDAIGAVRDALELADAQFGKVAELFRALAKVRVNEAKVRAYIDAVFPPPPAKTSASVALVGTAPEQEPHELIELPDIETPAVASAVTVVESNGVADFAALLGRPARLSAVPAMAIKRALATVAPPSPAPAPVGDDDSENRRVQDNIVEILERGGRGLDHPAVRGTAWAAYNAVTEYLTWERGRSADNRMTAVMFGDIGTKALAAAKDAFLG